MAMILARMANNEDIREREPFLRVPTQLITGGFLHQDKEKVYGLVVISTLSDGAGNLPAVVVVVPAANQPSSEEDEEEEEDDVKSFTNSSEFSDVDNEEAVDSELIEYDHRHKLIPITEFNNGRVHVLARFTLAECFGYTTLAQEIQGEYVGGGGENLSSPHVGWPWGPVYRKAEYFKDTESLVPMDPFTESWNDFSAKLEEVRVSLTNEDNTVLALEVYSNQNVLEVALDIPKSAIVACFERLVRAIYLYYAAYNNIEPKDTTPLDPWPMAVCWYRDHNRQVLEAPAPPPNEDNDTDSGDEGELEDPELEGTTQLNAEWVNFVGSLAYIEVRPHLAEG